MVYKKYHVTKTYRNHLYMKGGYHMIYVCVEKSMWPFVHGPCALNSIEVQLASNGFDTSAKGTGMMNTSRGR